MHQLRKDLFPWIVVLFMVALVFGFRSRKGSSLGLQHPVPSKKSVEYPSGLISNIEDNFSYASWAQQAKHGHFFFKNLYTTNKHEALLINPYFYLVGKASKATGYTVAGLMNLLGVVGMIILLLMVYLCAFIASQKVSVARWAVILAALSSGSSSFLQWMGIGYLQGYIEPGADILYLDAIFLSSFFAAPYQVFIWGIMSVVCYQAMVWAHEFEKRGWSTKAIAIAFTLCVLSSFLAASHPYEPVMLLASFVGTAITAKILGAKSEISHRTFLFLFLLLVFSMVPWIGYNFWVSKQLVWKDFAKAAFTIRKSRIFWIVGYGFVFVVALIGLWRTFRKHANTLLLFFGVWTTITFGALILLKAPQTRICNGAYFAISMMAALGWSWTWETSQSLNKPALRVISRYCLLFLTLLFFPTTIDHLAFNFGRHMYDVSLYEAGNNIIQEKPSNRVTVLCSTSAGTILPGTHGVRVYAGHWGLTTNYEQRKKELLLAGFKINWDGKPPSSQKFLPNLRKLLEKTTPDFILVKTTAPLFLLLQRKKRIKPIFANKKWNLFSRQQLRNL